MKGEVTNAEVVERLTRLATAVTVVSELGNLPVAHDSNGNIASLEHLMLAPMAIQQNAQLRSIDSLIAYVNRHKNADSILTSNQDSNKFGFIADYHSLDNSPHWKRHRAHLTLEHTVGMKAWLAQHNKKMTQEQFGLFLEENAGDIVNPSAATMLQVATELRAHKTSTYDSKVNLDNGAMCLSYKEDIKGTFVDGKQEIPTKFQIGVTPYRGMPAAYKLDCSLRYRIDEAKQLWLWYSIPLLDRLLEQAFSEIKAQIVEGTNLPIFDGDI